MEKYLIILFFFVGFISHSFSQTPVYSWQGGSNVKDQPTHVYQPPPGGREGAVSWIDDNDDLWIFGGGITYGITGNFNDLWKFEISTNRWFWISGSDLKDQDGSYGTLKVASSSNVPGARTQSASWIDSFNNLWLFGGEGRDKNGNFGRLNDLWKFDTSSSEWTWMGGSDNVNQIGNYGVVNVPHPNNVPGARKGSNYWLDSSDNFWLFGGSTDASSDLLNDFWKFDGTNWTWIAGSNVINQPTLGNQPGARYHSVSWNDNQGNLLLFGGYGLDQNSLKGVLNDFWKFDIVNAQWTKIGGSSDVDQLGFYGTLNEGQIQNIPGGRRNALAWTDNSGDMWLFGGNGWGESEGCFGPLCGGYGLLNDFWKHDGENWIWMGGSKSYFQPYTYGNLYEGNTSYNPGHRSYSISWIDSSDNLWLFGGRGGDGGLGCCTGRLNDLWRYEQSSTEWAWMGGSLAKDVAGIYSRQLKSEFNNPGARGWAVSWGSALDSLWLFGGVGYNEDGVPGFQNDLWYYDPKTLEWTLTREADGIGVYGSKFVSDPANVPGGRIEAISWETSEGAMLLFGGNSGIDLMNDLWTYNHLTKEWIWFTGSDLSNQEGTYGTINIGSPVTTPGARSRSLSWIDASDNLFMFGGKGYDRNGTLGMLNDLWKFSAVGGGSPYWIWLGGSDVANQIGVYRTVTIPNPESIPGAREYSVSWEDASGNLWLFGGQGLDANGDTGRLNDLWKYDPTTSLWTWVGGSDVINAIGTYGILQKENDENVPGARMESTRWIDPGGNFWLFGGLGYDENGEIGELNDLWRYSPSTGKWAWMGGSKLRRQDDIFGIKGTGSVSNAISGRYASISWQGTNDFWLFGGTNRGQTALYNDIRKIEFIPGPPEISGFSTISKTGFEVSWPVVELFGVENYEIDVGTDVGFTNILSEFNSTSTTSNSISIVGLDPGSTYFVRARSVNTLGVSINSNTASQITVPENPTAENANSITQNSFTASWNSVPGSDYYYLEVSSNSDFSTLVSGYDGTIAISAVDTSIVVVGLDPGITYYYRATSENNGGKSGTSNVISQITIPANPIAIDPLKSDVTTSSFKANWVAVSGVSIYEFEISEDDFTTQLLGYDPKTIDSLTTQEIISGLSSETTYTFRVRAKNSAGISGNSNIISVITDIQVDTSATILPLTLETINFSSIQSEAESQTLNIDITEGTTPYVVVFMHKGILETVFSEVVLTEMSTGVYSTEIAAVLLDKIGLDFEVIVTDAVGEVESQSGQIFRYFEENNSPGIPFEKFGGTDETWNLFSIPYELDNKSVSSIFADYDPARHEFDWKIVRFRNATTDFVNFNTGQVKTGEGYFFNAKEKVVVQTGSGQTNSQIPFSKGLVQGWNLVGNPYNVDISWNSVITSNREEANVEPVYKFTGSGFSLGDVIQPFSGGFVWAESATSVDISPMDNGSGARLKNNKITNRNIDDLEWIMPITIKTTQTEYQQIAVGMHPEASMEKDGFDQMTLPRFFNYMEMYVTHDNYFYPWFSEDITQTVEEQTWKFTMESDILGEKVLLEWNQSVIQNNISILMLVDEKEGRIIDMKEQGKYEFTFGEKRNFVVYYSLDPSKSFIPSSILLGDAYPNPAESTTIIPVTLPDLKEKYNISLDVYNMQGQKIRTLTSGHYTPGFYEFEWDEIEKSSVPNGIYLYRLVFEDPAIEPAQKRIIIQH